MTIDKVTEVPKLLKDATHRQYLPDVQLGAGGFATCFRASMVDRRAPPETSHCALKAVKSAVPKNLIQRFRLELAIQSKLRHKNIVEMYRAFTFQDVTYVALELCPNGSLTDMMRKRKYLTMGEIRRMLVQLCGAVKYLHERDVVHRDIKAGNIFLDSEMNVKLGDFGLAAIMEPSPQAGSADAQALQHIRRTTFCGTPNYLAPEILSRHEGHGTSVDIWAIGILAYYLAVGRAPFHSKSKDEIYARLRKGEYSWPELAPEQNEIPEDLRSLVGSLLVEENMRPTCDEIVEHAFLKDGFIPERLEVLCRTRRPRWSRILQPPGAASAEQTKIYNQLCIQSQVGRPWREHLATLSKQQRPNLKSMFLILAKEVSERVKLEIPLKEGIVYTGRIEAVPEQSLEQASAARLTLQSKPRRERGPVPFEILEDETAARAAPPQRVVMLPSQRSVNARKAQPFREALEQKPARETQQENQPTVETQRLRPLRGRPERGYRVRQDVAAIEKRQRELPAVDARTMRITQR